jgi:hypothetical protein
MTNHENKMTTEQTTQDCGRKGDLMDYLYNESNAAAHSSFERHLADCDACSGELNAFNRVRDDLSAWQVGLAPRTEVVLPRRKLDALRELIRMFPVWARGAALAGAAALLVSVTLSIAGASVRVKGGEVAIDFGKSAPETAVAARSSEEMEKLAQAAVAREREKMQSEYQAQMAAFKDQLTAEYKARLEAASAEHQAKIQAVRASLRSEIARVERQNRNIRPFFDSDENTDLWSTGR